MEIALKIITQHECLMFSCFRQEGLSGFFCGCITYIHSQAGKIITVKDHMDSSKLQQEIGTGESYLFKNGEN